MRPFYLKDSRHYFFVGFSFFFNVVIHLHIQPVECCDADVPCTIIPCTIGRANAAHSQHGSGG